MIVLEMVMYEFKEFLNLSFQRSYRRKKVFPLDMKC